ncbi:PA14 domain-containing protein [Aliidongia dinghuensis]|uniref:PA14 domain-containing protein n=1 Tax=Aliidongia dinghuensis TaxID=1867774 RepID=UPI0016663180|nr:PA14 domain-containing protein [Aliidongia dinghuensis]
MGSPSQAHAQGVVWGGFIGQYQSGTAGVTQPAFQRRDARIDFTWNAAGPGGSTSPEFSTAAWSNFSASWTGQIIATTSETYSFRVQSSDSVSLAIRPTGSSAWTTLVTDGASGARTDTASFALTAGKSYDIAMHYFQHGRSGSLRLGWSSPTVPFQVIEAATPLGINSAAVLPGEPGNIFADVVKQAKPFGAYSNSAAVVATDANGWPLADASLALWSSGREMNGTYQVTFNGAAKLVDWTGLGSFSVGGVSYGATLPFGVGYNAGTNVTTAEWTVSNAAPAAATLGFAETRRTATSATGSGITNLRIMRPLAPGSATPHAVGELFSAEYKSFLSYFTGIRFMDYLATNGNRQVNWSDRVKPTDATQYQPKGGYGWQGKGASWEDLVALANETGKDVWINIPVYASDDYVTKLAELLAYGSDGATPYTGRQSSPAYPPLNSNLKVYIEYSNEVWNTSFPQYNSNVALAEAEVAAGNSPLDYDKNGRSFVWERRRVAKRIMEVSNLFRAVWGDAAMMTQIRPVFEWQYGNMNETAAVGLDFLDSFYNNADGVQHVANPHPVNYFLYGGGGGWYVAPIHQGLGTAAAVFASGQNVPSTGSDALWANAFGLKAMGYEGGFEVGGDTGTASEVALNLDPGVLGQATQALNAFFHLGGTMPFIFNAAGATAYGVANPTINEQNTPKMQAILALGSNARPLQQIACHAPCTIPYQGTSGVTSSGYVTNAIAKVGDYMGFSISVATPGNFTVASDAARPTAVRILIDNVPVGTGTWTGTLSSGVHGIRLQNVLAGGTTLTKLVVTQAK